MEFNSQRFSFRHQYGRLFLFWDINMAAVTSFENTVGDFSDGNGNEDVISKYNFSYF